jgi:hypothetical protein
MFFFLKHSMANRLCRFRRRNGFSRHAASTPHNTITRRCGERILLPRPCIAPTPCRTPIPPRPRRACADLKSKHTFAERHFMSRRSSSRTASSRKSASRSGTGGGGASVIGLKQSLLLESASKPVPASVGSFLSKSMYHLIYPHTKHTNIR